MDELTDLLRLAEQVIAADYSPLVTKFARAVIATADDTDVGIRMRNISRMTWDDPRDGFAFHVVTTPGRGQWGATLLEALRGLDTQREEA